MAKAFHSQALGYFADILIPIESSGRSLLVFSQPLTLLLGVNETLLFVSQHWSFLPEHPK